MTRLPLFWLAAAFLLGIPCAATLLPSEKTWKIFLALAAFFYLLEIITARRLRVYPKIREILPVPFFLVILIFSLGGWRYTVSKQPFQPSRLAFYNESGKIEINGVICEDPKLKENSSQLVVCANSIKLSSGEIKLVEGKALVKLRTGDWHYGEGVNIYGAPAIPPENEDFSYRAYLEQHGIYTLLEYPYVVLNSQIEGSWIKKAIFSLRQTAYNRINAFLPQPEAGLLSGILLGNENDIPSDLEKAYQDTGTAHIIAISGFNMALLVGIFLKGFRRWLPIWWAGLLTICLISIYTILVGAAPAVVRAAVMSCLAMSGQLIGRRQAGPFTLLITAAVMCAFNPLLIWEAGFQLSFMATLGLVIYADRLMNWFKQRVEPIFSQDVIDKISAPVGEYFLFTLAAQVTTLPIILYHFERISLSTLLANPLILPVQPLIMMLGGISIITGLIIPPLGKILSYIVWVPLVYTNKIVTLLSEIPVGSMNFGRISFWTVLIIYGLLFFFTYRRKKDHEPEGKNEKVFIFGMLVMLTAVVLVWNGVLLRPDGRLRVMILDEPNTGVVLVQTPGDKRLLINSGGYTNSLSSELNKRLPLLDRRLDLMLVTRASADQYQAFPRLLERFSTGQFIWAVPFPKTTAASQIQRQLNSSDINSQFITSGMQIDFGDGVVLEMMSGDEKQALLLLKYGDLQIWLPGGEVDPDREGWVIQGGIVILPPGTKNSAAWLALQPQQVIHQEVGLCSPQDGCLSTRQYGWISLESDGKNLWFSHER